MRIAVWAVFVVAASVVGCASHSTQAVLHLDPQKPQYKSADCRRALNDARLHDDLKLSRMLITPVAVFLSGGVLALPAIAANAGLNTADHLSASYISVACGGQAHTAEYIGTEVAKDLAIDVVLNGVSGSSALAANN